MASSVSAILGTFVKIEPISTRKMVRIGIEIPEEQADEVLKLLGGYPKPANPVWVAVAPITEEAAVAFSKRANKESEVVPDRPVPSEKSDHKNGAGGRSWSDLSPAQQAGIRCSEKAFWKFLDESTADDEELSGALGIIITGEDAANYVRLICGVKTRATLSTDHVAGAKWRDLDLRYNNWLHGLTPEIAA